MTRKRTKKYIIYKNRKPMMQSLIFGAIMLLISFGCMLLPLIKGTGFADTVLCFSVGGVGIAYFCFIIFYFVLKLTAKQPAIAASADGVAVYTINSKRCFLPRADIVSIKVFGNKKNKYIGFVVDDISSIDGIEKSGVEKAILKNHERDLPSVVISSREIYGNVKSIALDIKEILSYGDPNESSYYGSHDVK